MHLKNICRVVWWLLVSFSPRKAEDTFQDNIFNIHQIDQVDSSMAFLFHHHHHCQHQSIHPPPPPPPPPPSDTLAASDAPSYFLDHPDVQHVNFNGVVSGGEKTPSTTTTTTNSSNCTQEPLSLQTLSRGHCHQASLTSHLTSSQYNEPSIETSVGQCLINDANSDSCHFLEQTLSLATFPQPGANSVITYAESQAFKSPPCHPRNPSQVTSSSDYDTSMSTKCQLMRSHKFAQVTSGKKSRMASYKGKSRQWDDAKRERANEQERRRMQELNEAMDRLRGCIPDRMRNPIKKLSKIDTLNAAIDYIRYLEQEIRVVPNGGQL